MRGPITILRENRFFFLPFAVWLAAGALLIHFYSKPHIFLFVNAHYDRFWDDVMGWMTYLAGGWALAILLLILLWRRKFRAFWLLVIVSVASGAITQILKLHYHLPRPALYFSGRDTVLHTVSWVPVHRMNSFPSGHTTAAFSLFCFLALVVKEKRWGAVFFFLAFLAGYSRMYLSQHFFTDVYAGSIIGTFVTLLIYWRTTLNRPAEI